MNVGPRYELTIAPIADQVVTEDGVASVAVSVSGSETGNLTFVGSDTNLVEHVSFTGTGLNRTALVHLVPNAHGNDTVTITVNDEIGGGTRSFGLKVLPVNDAPELAVIADQVTTANVPVTLTLDVSDIEHGSDQLRVLRHEIERRSRLGCDVRHGLVRNRRRR